MKNVTQSSHFTQPILLMFSNFKTGIKNNTYWYSCVKTFILKANLLTEKQKMDNVLNKNKECSEENKGNIF